MEKGRLGEMEARRTFGQLCLGVGYIHSRGVVHRDLKLENVLLDERCNVKIADFGFGREFEQRRLMETYCGTTGYAAPEMLAGKKYTGEGKIIHHDCMKLFEAFGYIQRSISGHWVSFYTRC